MRDEETLEELRLKFHQSLFWAGVCAALFVATYFWSM